LGLVEGVHIAGEKTDDSYRYLGDCDLCPSFGTSDAFMQRSWSRPYCFASATDSKFFVKLVVKFFEPFKLFIYELFKFSNAELFKFFIVESFKLFNIELFKFFIADSFKLFNIEFFKLFIGQPYTVKLKFFIRSYIDVNFQKDFFNRF
jgi:hypothetical protein